MYLCKLQSCKVFLYNSFRDKGNGLDQYTEKVSSQTQLLEFEVRSRRNHMIVTFKAVYSVLNPIISISLIILMTHLIRPTSLVMNWPSSPETHSSTTYQHLFAPLSTLPSTFLKDGHVVPSTLLHLCCIRAERACRTLRKDIADLVTAQALPLPSSDISWPPREAFFSLHAWKRYLSPRMRRWYVFVHNND